MDAQFLSKLIFEDNGGLPFTLVRPLVFLSMLDGKFNKLTVPRGFKTDLASIPRFFWRVLPPVGKYDAAAVVHDFLYQQKGVPTRKHADQVLREAMTVLGVPRWQRVIIYSGVRVGGWKVWNAYRAKDGR